MKIRYIIILMVIVVVVKLGFILLRKSNLNPFSKNDKKIQIEINTLFFPPDTSVTIDYLLGHIKAENDTTFQEISLNHALRKGLFLKKETYQSFLKMSKAAQQDNIHLIIISGFRSFSYQKRIWENKWKRKSSDSYQRAKEILKYTAMPGTSRHHWGTDIDLYSLRNQDFENGKGKNIYDWLSENAVNYGFCQTYTEKDSLRPNGYEEEKWHWSYMPLAKKYAENYEYKIASSDIQNFNGAILADTLNIIEEFVFGINPKCK